MSFINGERKRMEIRRCSFVRETKDGLSCMAGTLGPYAVILGFYDAKETNLMMFFLRPRNDLRWKGKAIIL